MMILFATMTRPIRLLVFLVFGQIGRVWRGDIRLADFFFAVCLREGRIGQTGPRFKERGSPRPALRVEAWHRGPAWGSTV